MFPTRLLLDLIATIASEQSNSVGFGGVGVGVGVGGGGGGSGGGSVSESDIWMWLAHYQGLTAAIQGQKPFLTLLSTPLGPPI